VETRAGANKVATEPEAVSAVIQLDPAVELHDFVFEHHSRLIRLATLVTRSVDEAEDAVQSASSSARGATEPH